MNTEINSKIKGPIGPLILVAFWAPLNPFWTCRLTNFDEFWVTKFGRYFAETAVLKNMSFCQISADFFGVPWARPWHQRSPCRTHFASKWPNDLEAMLR